MWSREVVMDACCHSSHLQVESVVHDLFVVLLVLGNPVSVSFEFQ